MKLSLPNSIKRGIFANSYGQIISASIQVLSLPIFLLIWNSEKYGIWLMLYAVPAYLSMMDFGVGGIASNKVVMAISKNETHSANTTFQSALLFTTTSIVLILAIAWALIFWIELGFGSFDSDWALFTLCATTALGMYGSILEIPYRARNRYDLGTYFANTSRLVEWAFMVCSALLFESYVSAALGMLIGRATSYILIAIKSKWKTTGLQFGFRCAQIEEIRLLLSSGMLYLLFPLSNAINLQGFTLLVGNMMGPTALVQFTAFRTISRLCLQATGIISHSFWVNFSTTYARGDYGLLNSLYKKGSQLTVLGSTLISIPLIVFGSEIIDIWGQGQIVFQTSYYLAFIVLAYIGAGWHLSRVLLLATNNHQTISIINLAVNITMIIIGYLATKHQQMEATVAALIAGEIAILIYSRRLAAKLLRTSP